jgi:hypothetical protein
MFDGQLNHKPKIRDVQAVVAAIHNLPLEAMHSANRKHTWAHPRQEAMALARELTGRSYPEIARMFGDRDHTTVIYAFRKIRACAATDEALAARLTEARARLAALAPAPQPQGESTTWQPPAPLRPAKPTRIALRLDLDAWEGLGGEVERVA